MNTDKNDSAPKTSSPLKESVNQFRTILLSRGFLIYFLIFYLGIFLIFFKPSGSAIPDFSDLMKQNWLQILGGLFVSGSFILMVSKLQATMRSRRNFSDVDRDSKRSISFKIPDDLMEEIRKINVTSKNKEIEILTQQLEKFTKNEYKLGPKSTEFQTYFAHMSSLILQKTENADEKASILLERGVSFTWFGIIFFLISIITWQIVAGLIGFTPQIISGIISTTFLFIFVEFLSAWFLRQYRHFVDTSTYLMKVKSILDRYMLSYLANREYPTDAKGISKAEHTLKLLSERLYWPDPKTSISDESFAKETMSSLARIIEKQSKRQGETDTGRRRKKAK